MINRRKFITHTSLSLLGASLFSGFKEMDSSAQQPSPPALFDGEEWKNIDFATISAYNDIDSNIIADAKLNIEKYRKGELNICITDKYNNPVTGLLLDIRQTDHEFIWGCSSAGDILSDKNIVVSALRTKNFVSVFNCTTAKCYWNERWHQPIEKDENVRITSAFTDEVQWALSNGLSAKGHPLVWTVPKAIPQWMDKYSYAEQLKRLEQHVRNLIQVGGAGVKYWDLCNEMLWEPSLRNLKQRVWPHIEPIDEILTYLEPAVHWARDANPNAVYSLNDYGLEKTFNPKITAETQRKRYVQLVEEMYRRGCLPDAIGTQAHVAGWYDMETFKKSLDELSEAGLPIQITEFWAHFKERPNLTNASEEQKWKEIIKYVTAIYTVAFGTPSVNHLTYWGGKEELFTEQGNPTPLFYALKKLIKTDWNTNIKEQTNQHGELMIKGYYGSYALTWTDANGNLFKKNFKIEKGVTQLQMVF